MGRGRPRKTDPETALEGAMKLFWEKGFEGTSMSDLVQTTGMAKPGLYATFGDKEALYAKALTLFFKGYGTASVEAFVQSTKSLKEGVREFLGKVIAMLTDRSNPRGCFIVNTLIECADHPISLETLAQGFNEERRVAFVTRFQRAQTEGDLPPAADAEALANFFSGQSLALGVMGRAGAGKKSLEAFVDVALTALPVQEISDE